MAPPRKVVREQLETMVDWLEENNDMCRGVAPGSPITLQASRQKWIILAKKLNAVPGGSLKTPEGWKKYWFEWRHKCRKKAADGRRYQSGSDSGKNRFIPLNDLEIRVLNLCGLGSVAPTLSASQQLEDFLAEESESEQTLDTIKAQSAPVIIKKRQIKKIKKDGSGLRSISKRESTDGLAGDTSVNIGMEALETSINYWEDALAAFSLGARGGVTGTLALTSPEEAEFCREIQDLLQNAYMLQERCELLFLDQRSVLFRSESGGAAGGGGAGADEAGAGRRRSRLLSTHTGSSHTRREHHSSAESFASAEDQVADLREFDDFTELVPELDSLELYQMAMKQLEAGIPYRTLRTDVVQCGSDSEFLCKLHCLRQAFRLVFRDAAAWAWYVDAGRQVLTDLLLFADKEPKEFLVAYEEMVSWATDAANWHTIESELSSKGVKALTFYDVVLDYILLDAFEDLAAPPSSVLAVVRNRWLSDGFKESALTTAVWSVIKAKRRYLQYPDGFMAHFYSISEHLLPVLVWGFLGPRERLRDMCHTFQAEVVGFITDLFSFHKCRYTTVDELASDVMQHARARAVSITDKLAERN